MSVEFYIINDVDCPDERHVVVKDENGIGRYNLANNGLTGYEFKNFDRATKLQDFGISIKKLSNGWYCVKDSYAIATYNDGMIRKWQGTHEFIIT